MVESWLGTLALSGGALVQIPSMKAGGAASSAAKMVNNWAAPSLWRRCGLQWVWPAVGVGFRGLL